MNFAGLYHRWNAIRDWIRMVITTMQQMSIFHTRESRESHAALLEAKRRLSVEHEREVDLKNQIIELRLEQQLKRPN